MSYQYLGKASNGNSKYKVTLNVYRDCGQSEVPLDNEIKLGVYLNNDLKDRYKVVTFKLTYKTTVQPPGSTDCDYYARNVCIEYGFYEGVIELATYSGGYHLTFVRCCRNIQNNLPNQNGAPYQGQTYYCYIPNTTYNNSSPVFSGVPSPYMCAKDTTTFLFNALDPDGDELSYKIVRPFQGGSPTQNGSLPSPPLNLDLPITPVFYNAGYSKSKPFGTSNGSITSIDASNGLTTFYAPNVGSYVVCVEVTEKRDGVVLSTIRMDLQILVLDCPPNKRPTISTNASKTITVEAGSTLCFDVNGSDADGDIVRLKGSGSILDGSNGFTGTRATFAEKAAVSNVTSEFCWKIDCDQFSDEPYIVSFEVGDNGCPPKFNYINVEIIVKPFVGTDQLEGPTEVCRYNTYLYLAKGGEITSTYEWEVTNGKIIGGIDGDIALIDWDGAITGQVRMREVSENGCFGEWVSLDVTIIESPPLPIISGKDTVCLNEIGLAYNTTFTVNNTYSWSLINANFSTQNLNNITINTYGTPSFTIKVTEVNEFGCASDTAEKEVYVSEPLPQITGPTTICPNSNNIMYSVNKNMGSVYSWGVIGGTQSSGGNTSEITIDWDNAGVGQIDVLETNRHGCISPPVSLFIDKTYVLNGNAILGPIDVCEYDAGVPYTTLEVNGSVFNWSVAGGAQVAGDSTSAILVDWGPTGFGKIQMQEKAYDNVNKKECLSNIVELDVTINPIPDADEITGITELCQYNVSTYSISGFLNSTYVWKINGDSSGITGQGTNTITVDWTSFGIFSISVMETSSAGCDGTVIDTTVIVNPKPTTTAIQGDIIICPESVLNQSYLVTGSNNSYFEWTVNGANNFTGQGTNNIIVNWEPTVAFGNVSVVEISDKGCVGDTQKVTIEIDRLAIDLRYISVGTPDDRMILSWELPFAASPNEFEIERRVAGGGAWLTIASVPGYVFSYIETNLNTDVTAYEYQIKAVNKCGTIIYSEPHTNINVVGFQDELFNINITFSNYLGWLNGVNSYSIYESVNGGPYSLKLTGVTPSQNMLIENDPDQYKKCYRIFADELFGEQTSTWSNEICFFFSPEIYVPNAFTPNGNNLNDGFGVKGIAINEYSMKIYNRWGEKLFETTDLYEKWVPIYKDAEVQMGTYIYVITYTDFENKIYTKTGTINLLR